MSKRNPPFLSWVSHFSLSTKQNFLMSLLFSVWRVKHVRLCRASPRGGGGGSPCKPRPWTMKAGPCCSFLCSHETPPSLMAVCNRNPSPSPPPPPAAAAPIWSNALQRRNLTAQSVSDGKPILISRDKETEAIYSLHTSSPQRRSSDDLKFQKFMFLIYDSASHFFCISHSSTSIK